MRLFNNNREPQNTTIGDVMPCEVCKALVLYKDAHQVKIESPAPMVLPSYKYYCLKCKPNYDYIDEEGKKFKHETREIK